MKVLLVSVKSAVSHGGIAVWTRHYLSECCNQGIETDLVNVEMQGRRATDGTAKRNLLDEFIRTRRIFKQLGGFLKNAETYDAAHLNTSCGKFGLIRDCMIGERIAKKGIPLVTHYHCDVGNSMRDKKKLKYLEKLAKLSRNNLVLSENSYRYMKDTLGIEAEKVPNFLDSSMILEGEKEIQQKLRRIFFVGRVEPQKGVAEIYELARRFPDMTFALAGAVRDSVAQWEKPENVELLGGMPHDQVIAQMDAADVFLFPSHSEGFSVALTESMARGLPAVATDVGAAADMLAADCGIVVPKGDVDAMEQALKALQDPAVRQSISKAAVEKVRRCYTTEAVVSQIKSIYKAKE